MRYQLDLGENPIQGATFNRVAVISRTKGTKESSRIVICTDRGCYYKIIPNEFLTPSYLKLISSEDRIIIWRDNGKFYIYTDRENYVQTIRDRLNNKVRTEQLTSIESKKPIIFDEEEPLAIKELFRLHISKKH